MPQQSRLDLILEPTTMKLLEGLSCLSNASELLHSGANDDDPEVKRWLVGASDDLRDAGLEAETADVRFALTSAISMLDRRDPRARDLVNPTHIDLLHRRVALTFRRHARSAHAK